MAHYAKVKNGIVETVIVAEAEFFETFVDDSPGEWIQTSYNTRGGVHYDPATGEPSEDQSKALRKKLCNLRAETIIARRMRFIIPSPEQTGH